VPLRFQSSQREKILHVIREGSNLSVKHPHTDVADANCLAYDIVTYQDRAFIINLLVLNHSLFGHVWYVHESSNRAFEYLPFLTELSRYHMDPHLLIQQPRLDMPFH